MADPTDARQTPDKNRDVPDLDDRPETTSRATPLPPGSPKPADGPPPDPSAPATRPVATDARPAADRPAADRTAAAEPAKSGGVSPVVWIALAAVLIAGGIYAYSVLVPPDLPEDRIITAEDPDPGGADTDDDLELEAETESLADDLEAGDFDDADDADLEPDPDGGGAEPLATGARG